MFTCKISVVSQSGMDLTVQTVETTETHILICLRSEARIPSKYGAATTLAAAHERFILTDGHDRSLQLDHMNSLSDGPFRGILYLAFPSEGELDLGTLLKLKSENAEVKFQL